MIQLVIEELAASLSLTTATVGRWIRQGRLPVRQKGTQCIFSQSTLKKWADANHLLFVLPGSGFPKESEIKVDTLLDAMKPGRFIMISKAIQSKRSSNPLSAGSSGLKPWARNDRFSKASWQENN